MAFFNLAASHTPSDEWVYNRAFAAMGVVGEKIRGGFRFPLHPPWRASLDRTGKKAFRPQLMTDDTTIFVNLWLLTFFTTVKTPGPE